MIIKAEGIYKDQGKNEPKFDHDKVTIGGVVLEPIPIRFIRKSEWPRLEEMLRLAADMGRAEAEAEFRAAENQRGVERYNRALAGLLENEKFGRKW